MIVFPAIDIRDKKAVRLTQGDYDKMSVYSCAPVDVAKEFEDKGTTHLHAVDLDGALCGETVNFDVVKEICRQTKLWVEIGGGIRDEERIARYLDAGVKRVILGTAAVEKPEFLDEMIAKYGTAISVGVDAKNKTVATRGWQKDTAIDAVEFARDLAYRGCGHVIVTDISKDGLLAGTNIELYEELKNIDNLLVTASGGVSSEKDIETLAEIGLYGAIVGKAIYENKLSVESALAAAKRKSGN